MRDALHEAWRGVRGRPGRAVMSGIGIALGIATLVLVTGIPASGQANLERRLTALGTNILVAQSSAASDDAPTLPEAATAMVRRIGPVEAVGAVASLDARVRRTPLADPNDTAGIVALAATGDLLETIHGALADGTYLSTPGLPTAVLGAQAAQWLGITRLDPAQPVQVTVGDARLTVVGILAPMPLTPELEQAVLVGWEAARELGFDGHPSVVYLRAVESRVEAVREVLPATLSPQLPGLVSVSRPSDALAAKRATQGTFSALFLGLAAVALAVGGIGVANTMIVGVLERRREIGLRRALGARRKDVRRQFLAEAVLLSLLGGTAGLVSGMISSVGFAAARGWPVVVPLTAVGGGLAGSVLVGALAGLYPAVRAARLPVTEALAT